MTMELASEPAFRLGGLTVRPSTREIIHPGGRESVEPRVMEVLLVLARAGGEVVSRDQLTEACWEGRVVSEDAINRVISRIRQLSRLTEGRDFTLETISKVGYRLVAQPATEVPAEAAQPAPPEAEASAAPVAPAKRRLDWRIVSALAAVVVLLAGYGVWRMTHWEPGAPDAPLTLAVLPFDDLSPGRQDDTLAIGLSRDIRNTLSRVRGLRVVSDASSFAVAAENIPAPDIGKRLNADLLIDGSLTREGDVVKLTAELVDGWTGVNMWTGSQSGAAGDLDHVRQLMSASIFEQLVARIGPKRLVATSPPRPANPKTYRLLLEAGELMRSASNLPPSPDNLEASLTLGDKAYGLLLQALVIEPNDASALVMLARMINASATHELRASNLSILDRQQKAADYMRQALAADPDNVQALAGLGEHYRRNEWRWADAEAMLQRAVALDPNELDTHLAYVYFLTTTGRCVDAVRHVNSVLAIDPEFGWRTLGLPRALKCAGEDKESNALYLRQLKGNADWPFLVREMYLNYLERKDVKSLRALPALVRENAANRPVGNTVDAALQLAVLAANAIEGDPAPYVARIEADVAEDSALSAKGLRNDFNPSAPNLMWTHGIEFAAAGATQRAIDMIEKAVADGSLYIPETLPYGAYEFSAAVRADPRYQAIWRRDPRLQELVRRRLAALQAGQMKGVLPDGREVSPPAERIVSRDPA